MTSLPYAADDRRDGINGLAYAMRNVAQLLLMCDRQDIGVSVDTDGSSVRASEAQRLPGGRCHDDRSAHLRLRQLSGRHRLQRAAVRHAGSPARRDRDLIRSCECERGCPSCVGPIGEIGPLGKRVALAILQRVAGIALEPHQAPTPDEDRVPIVEIMPSSMTTLDRLRQLVRGTGAARSAEAPARRELVYELVDSSGMPFPAPGGLPALDGAEEVELALRHGVRHRSRLRRRVATRAPAD